MGNLIAFVLLAVGACAGLGKFDTGRIKPALCVLVLWGFMYVIPIFWKEAYPNRKHNLRMAALTFAYIVAGFIGSVLVSGTLLRPFFYK